MIVIKNSDAFYLEDGRIFIDVNKMQEALKDQVITITDSYGLSRMDNVIDTRILFWLGDNFSQRDFYKFTSKEDYKKIFEDLKTKLMYHKNYVEQAKILTKLYLMINKNHTFEINRPFFRKLKSYYSLKDNTRSKFEKYNYDGMENLEDIKKGIQYEFTTSAGKIIEKGFNISKFDRKRYIGLFKPRNDCRYYILDFSEFEPSCLNFYIKDFISEGFYLMNAENYSITRKEFKKLFIAWLYGATEKKLGAYLELFRRDFPEVEELRKSLKSSRIQNVFGTVLNVDRDYKKMNYLVASTAGDVTKKIHVGLYNSGILHEGFRLIFSLFDEFLIEVSPGKSIEDIKKYFEIYDFIKIKVQEV